MGLKKVERCKIHNIFIGKTGCKQCNEDINETDSFTNMNVEEINALRGFAAACTFQHDALIKWQECYKFKPSESKEKLINQLERQRTENLKMLAILNADLSQKNWERIKKEIAKIHKIAAEFMNNRDLGEWEIKTEWKHDRV